MSKIMLVEDDNNLREIYEARLQAEGYVLVSARDGEEALVMAKNEKPDLIISDIMMPKISGFEMLDILRNTDGLKEVKVIMLTALGQSDDQQRADRLGADRYLVKSQVTLEDIVKVAHELLQDQPEAVAAPAVAPVADAPSVAAPALVEPPVTPPEPVAAVVPTPQAVEPATVSTLPVPDPTPVPVAPATPVAPTPVAIDVPEPVTPVADDVSASEAPVPEPVVEQANIAQPTAQEEATVEAEIQDFVNSNLANAEVEPSATPIVSVQPSMQPSSTPQTVANNDGQAMAEAVDSLTAQVPATDIEQPSTAPTTFAPQATSLEEVATSQPPTANGSVPIAHKKVIAPLDLPPKQDINTLAALEDAKTAAAAPAPAPVIFTSSNDMNSAAPNPTTQPITIAAPAPTTAPLPGVTETPATPGTNLAPENPLDPNHIAL